MRRAALAASAALLLFAASLPALSAPPADAPAPPAYRAQDTVAFDFIRHILLENRDSVAALFEDTLRPLVTPELVKNFQGRFAWLYNFIGGEFEEFYSGWADSVSYFREYRMSNELNKRAPLILVQVVFPDSVTPVLVGAQIKSFVGGNEKRVAEGQTWALDSGTYELHSIVAVQTAEGHLLAVQFYDDDADSLTQAYVARHGIPLAREAVRRGYLDSAAKVVEGASVLPDVGVVFIRKDSRQGLVHVKVSFRPEDMGPPGAPGKAPAAAPSKPAAKKKKKTP